ESMVNHKIEAAPDEWDRTYGVDFYIRVNDKHLGLQIKPISSGQSINQYQWIEMHRKNHERFENDFGGRVFFVYSVKGAGKKKKIFNIEVIQEIIDEIKRLS
ncbi:MAG: MjaI family restriction endonuclease, partial [Desulfobacterales bacterium]|nr:MjaI family restriction endonuclease [Desulfobacterales bacterium]